MFNKLTYLSPSYRSHPDAAEFAEVLSRYLPDWSCDLGDYAWDTEIPPRDQWERQAAELAEHMESL